MNTITINVSPEIANSFERADVNAKNSMESYINMWLNETFSKKTANESLLNIMAKSSAEAKSNGYKPEMRETIIEDILRGDYE